MAKLRLFEAFAGIGSQRLALRNIGADFESVGILEVDRYGLLAYAAIHEGFDWEGELPSDQEMLDYMNRLHIAYNFTTEKSELPTTHEDIAKLYIASKKAKNYGDIRLAKTEDLPDMDFFTYSFPCKDFSTAGLRKGGEKGSGTRSALVWECERIIAAKRPKYLMMENVPGMVDSKNIHILYQWRDLLSSLGYTSYWKVLNAADFGTPQERRRVIMFSVHGDHDLFEFQNVRQVRYLKLKDILEPGEVEKGYYINQDKYPCKRLEKRRPTKLFDAGVGNSRMIVAGHYPTVFNSDISIYDPEGACPTITATHHFKVDYDISKQKCIKVWDAFGPRAMVPVEAWRAQTIPEADFRKAEAAGIDPIHLLERAGRAICIKMLEAQYRRLFKDYLHNQPEKEN